MLSRQSRSLAGWLLPLLFSWSAVVVAAEPAIPESLAPWKKWVLQGENELECPFIYNDLDQHHCAWPSRLMMELQRDGGRFRQQWEIFAETEIALPGDERHWPQGVSIDGKPAVVLEKEGLPRLRLAPGKHQIHGTFLWGRLPDAVRIPKRSGLVELSVEGQRVAAPRLEANGRLWLREKADAQAGSKPSGLRIQVFRRLIDEIPFRTVTRIELAVAGEPREVVLGHALWEKMAPLSFESPLPARVEPDGRIRIQLRPGQWTLVLTARHLGPVHDIRRAAADGPWADAEIWSFDARPQLRLVQLQGLTSIDPQQSEIPADWKRLPAFRVLAGDKLTLEEKRRGISVPEPARLQLDRTLWLDFDGGGYTLQDRIDGQVAAPTRLELAAPFLLGRAGVDGREQFITYLDNPAVRGLELRPGPLSMVADSRLEPSGSDGLPATGWNLDFQKASATLQLPPGWRLLAASGVDYAPSTWLQRWTLLDLFLVLIGAMAAERLFGWPIGVLALATLALTYHEPGAPQWSWLFLLGAVVLRRVLPPGRGRRFATGTLSAGIVVLALVALPFIVGQVRQAIYPVLERPGSTLELGQGTPAGGLAAPAPAERKRLKRKAEGAGISSFGDSYSPDSYEAREAEKPLPLFDETMKVQTGPGVPDWYWNSYALGWSGPVSRNQRMELYLVPPGVNRLLALIRPILVLLLAAVILGIRLPRPSGRPPAGKALLLLPLVAALWSTPGPAAAQEAFPPPELLKELKSRLLQAPECAPRCATSPRLTLRISGDTLRVRQEVHAAVAVAVPLPGRADQWLPATVSLDGRKGAALFRDESGVLWMRVSAGVHQLLLEGALPAHTGVQLALPLTPHRVETEAAGWQVHGLRPDGTAEPLLFLERIRSSGADTRAPELVQGNLPPFVTVERTIDLGLSWRVTTRVLRRSSSGEGVVLSIPLLPGESVTTPGINVADQRVQLSLPPQSNETGWQSVLVPTDSLVLKAPEVNGWTEIWRVTAGPVWKMTHKGLPPVSTAAPGLIWRPWPGERLTLTVNRAKGANGNTLTIDDAHLRLRQGSGTTESTLEMTLRSSRGGQYRLALPDQADLQSVMVDGASRPATLVEGDLTLPLIPGSQTIKLVWQTPETSGLVFHSPSLDLGAPGVNGHIEVVPSASRWILFVGGDVPGPAVLYWGTLLVLALLAFGLGRWQLTPLPAWQWFLLGIGLSQVYLVLGLLVVGWLLALGARCRLDIPRSLHNAVQVLLGLLTLTALLALVGAVSGGLLGYPDMQIAGNGSGSGLLHWYQDRLEGELATAWVLSVPIWAYRLLMLLWALWLASALLGWLRWGWKCYRSGALWITVPIDTK